MHDTILVPFDGSKESKGGAEHAIELAGALGAKVHGLYVVEKGSNPWSSESFEDQRERAEDYAMDVLSELQGMTEAAGVEYESNVVFGPSVHGEITEFVEENEIDAIVMGTGYYGKVGSLLGSTAEKVIRNTRVPVTTIRRG